MCSAKLSWSLMMPSRICGDNHLTCQVDTDADAVWKEGPAQKTRTSVLDGFSLSLIQADMSERQEEMCYKTVESTGRKDRKSLVTPIRQTCSRVLSINERREV